MTAAFPNKKATGSRRALPRAAWRPRKAAGLERGEQTDVRPAICRSAAGPLPPLRRGAEPADGPDRQRQPVWRPLEPPARLAGVHPPGGAEIRLSGPPLQPSPPLHLQQRRGGRARADGAGVLRAGTLHGFGAPLPEPGLQLSVPASRDQLCFNLLRRNSNKAGATPEQLRTAPPGAGRPSTACAL